MEDITKKIMKQIGVYCNELNCFNCKHTYDSVNCLGNSIDRLIIEHNKTLIQSFINDEEIK